MKKSKKGGSKKSAKTYNNNKTETQEPQSVDEIKVKLKPIAGILPIKYVPFLYVAGIALLIFLILFLPGIRNNGSVIFFDSHTDGAAVYVDKLLVGSTPCTAFVTQGDHSIKFIKTGFETLTLDKKIDGRIFGSWIAPRKETIQTTLKLILSKDLVSIKFGDFYGWLSAGGYQRTKDKPLPPTISHLAEDIYRTNRESEEDSAKENEQAKFFKDVWRETLAHVNSMAALKDMVHGEMIASAGGSVMTSASLLNSLCSYAEIVEEGPMVTQWFESISAIENKDTRKIFPIAIKPIKKKKEDIIAVSREGRYPSTTWGFTRFIEIEGASYTRGHSIVRESYEAPTPETPIMVLPFAIMENEVSIAFFNEFTEENPQWSVTNKEKLIAAGLADTHYLDKQFDSDLIKSDSYPIRNISWFAANDFCRWFTEKYLAGTNLKARLPYDAEWEYAARLNQRDEEPYVADIGDKIPGAIGLQSMVGGVWEWTLSDYGEYDYFFKQSNYAFISNYFDSADAKVSERVVKGGCWVANSSGKNPISRGAQPPEWSTPFTGFRIVLEKQPRPIAESDK